VSLASSICASVPVADVPEMTPVAPIQERAVATYEVASSFRNVNNEVTAKVVSRADEAVVAQYDIPDGVFFLGSAICKDHNSIAFSFNNKEARYLLGSPYASYTWRNTSLNTTANSQSTWSYIDVNASNTAGSLVWATSNTFNYESAATNAPLTYDGTASFATYAPRLSVDGSATFGENWVIQYGYSTDQLVTVDGNQYQAYNPSFTWDVLSYMDNLGCNSYYMSWVSEYWSSAVKESATIEGYGILLPKPEAMYGLNGIGSMVYLPTRMSAPLEVTVYPVTAEGMIDYVNPIGGGKLQPDQMNPDQQYTQLIYVPMQVEDPDLGAVNTTINIDQEVFIMIHGVTDPNVRVYGFRANNTTDRGTTFCCLRLGNGQIAVANLSGLQFTPSGADAYCWKNMYIGLDVTTSALEIPEQAKVVEVPAAGKTYTIKVFSLYDLAEGDVSFFYGKGLDEWYTVEFTPGNESGYYNMELTVDPLGDATGRASKFTIYTPGAEAYITIKQGEVSGIGSVEADAEVVASEYFDMMGRKLNAEPQSGMFIRKDLKADGTTVATKLAK
ncbi:MAG: hypothetical protein K2L49_10220, partial [Muribaculaceae bacterium]|nr:hypothetical protein [Muribaculaceae bacterium]